LPLPDPEALLATSPDGHTALIRESSREARLWDTRLNESRGEALRHDSKIWAAEFSADGQFVATVGQDQHVRLWDSGQGKRLGEPMRHGGIVKALAIGRDGRLVISGSSDRTARMWNVQTCMPVGQPMRHPNEVRKVALSPDSRLALAVCIDGSALLWDTESCKLLARPLQYGISRGEKPDDESVFKVIDGEFNSDGTVILFTCSDGTARLYDVPQPMPDNPDMIRLWGRARSGFQLDEKSTPRQLSQAEWLKAQKELELLQKRN
jgi:WD40 repeat protein